MAEAARRARAEAAQASELAGNPPAAGGRALGPAPSPWEAPDLAALHASPALRMQQRLAERIGEEAIEDRWPWRATVAFVLVTCSAFWTTVYALLRVLIG